MAIYRARYLLGIPEEAPILFTGSKGTLQELEPEAPASGNSQRPHERPEYQPDPEDLENLQKPQWWDDYNNIDYEQERDETNRLNLDREQNYWAERDYRDYMELERELEREFERSDYPFHDFNYGP